MDTTFISLASKSNFNKALRHFFSVTDIVDEVESDSNLADVVNKLLDADEIQHEQVLPFVGAIIRDKFQYSYDSYSLTESVSDFSKIAEEVSKWSALDIVIVYFSPLGDAVLINPKNTSHFDIARELTKDQLVVIYSKYLKNDNKKLEEEAISSLEEMLAGKDVFSNKEFIDQTRVAKPVAAPQPVQAPGKKSKNVTEKYPVVVSNELFHNGNVEAWKKIIESYHTKFPDLTVTVYFEGELINDINALFKWGKVKHADSIFFDVAGDNIKGVSKLKKYLYEGASPRFEQFLKVGIGQVLNLF